MNDSYHQYFVNTLQNYHSVHKTVDCSVYFWNNNWDWFISMRLLGLIYISWKDASVAQNILELGVLYSFHTSHQALCLLHFKHSKRYFKIPAYYTETDCINEHIKWLFFVLKNILYCKTKCITLPSSQRWPN